MLGILRKFVSKLQNLATMPDDLDNIEYMTIVIKPTGLPDYNVDAMLPEDYEINVIYDCTTDEYLWEIGGGRHYPIPKECIEEVVCIA